MEVHCTVLGGHLGSCVGIMLGMKQHVYKHTQAEHNVVKRMLYC